MKILDYNNKFSIFLNIPFRLLKKTRNDTRLEINIFIKPMLY